MAKKRATKSSTRKKAPRKKTTATKSVARKSAAKKTGMKKSTTNKKKASGKRELINTGRDKRYVRRGAEGQFKESDDVGRSLSSDRPRKAKRKTKPGYGDRGDR